MGDCASRPTEIEIENHMKNYNRKNEKFFRTVPHYNDHSEFLLLENNISILKSRKSLYERKNKEFLQKSQSVSESNPPIKEFIIEIQKGVYLDSPGLCIGQGKPFVVVSLEPNGPYHETFEGDLFKPLWYRVINIKTVLKFKFINFAVKKSNNETLGSFRINVSSIKNQMAYDDWYKLQYNDNKAAIKVRVQYIESEKKLYSDLASKCLEHSKDIDIAIKNIQAKYKEI